MLTDSELHFLKGQKLLAADVYDGRGQSAAAWKAGVRVAGLTLVLGTPCEQGGHRLRTRSGHCAQCNTSRISYQNRYNSPGYVYIAGSQAARLIKIGTATDISQRERNLRHQAYGGVRDWEMLFSAKVANAGQIENETLRRLRGHKVGHVYEKDGSDQEAIEILEISITKALNVLSSVLEGVDVEQVERYADWNNYNFPFRSTAER